MSKKNELVGLITGLVALIATACFFLLGFTIGRWELIWLVFLAVPVTAIIGDIVTRNKDLSGSIIGIIAILAAAVFFILGFSKEHLWHPGWLVFLAIPLAAIIAEMIKKKSGAVGGLAVIVSVVLFILLGFFVPDSWQVAWLVFLLIPMTAIISNMVKTVKTDEGEKPEEKAE